MTCVGTHPHAFETLALPTDPGQDATGGSFASFTTHRIQTAPGVNLFVREAGNGEALVLLHGWPQHGLMWHTVAPALAKRFRVIVPDLRGAGNSSIPADGYDKVTMAADIVAVMDALGIRNANIAGYDLGAGVAYALAGGHRERVVRLAVMEFGLAGFGYESFMVPTPDWTDASNWHLGLFTVPDVAIMAFQGRERELLSWFFWHIAHDGEAVSPEHFEAYLRAIQRPGALRAGIMYYASVWQDAADNARLAAVPLDIPVLGIGGAMSGGPYIEQLFRAVATKVAGAVIPKAGHWLGDENPEALAQVLSGFFDAAVPGRA
ncbi:MAG: alpha/beta fold hydrolase [Phreatobacter sp.]|uniref:alpha/beta fold hydrolase n=1 Tax=Phreatobacter sp. TaxID=1966341 RepID=UPI004036233F